MKNTEVTISGKMLTSSLRRPEGPGKCCGTGEVPGLQGWSGRPRCGFSEPESGCLSHDPPAFSRASNPTLDSQRPAGLGPRAGGGHLWRGTAREVTCGRGTQRGSSPRSALTPCPLARPPLLARGCASRSRPPRTTHQMASPS